MDVIADISWSPVDQHRYVLSAAVRSRLAAILSISLALGALFLLARRLAGGLTAPLPALPLVGVALIAIAAALAVHLLCRTSTADSGILLRSVTPPLLTILALPVIAIALSLPGTPAHGLIGLWITIAIAEIGLWQLRRSRPTLNLLRNGNHTAPAIEPSTPEPPISLADRVTPASTPQEPATATQRLVYHRSTDGGLCVEGWVRAHFIAQQRTAIVHIAFCPAFDHTPQVDAELVDGPLGELRPTLVLPWGVRWELKLDAPATEPLTAAFEFIAQAIEHG